jgi:hypothetical protein
MDEPTRPPLNETGEAIDTPEGKVRNGNRWPYKKATRDEVAARITFVRSLLSKGAHEHEVRRFCYSRYNVRHRQASNYIAQARSQLRESAGVTFEEERISSVALYRELIRTSDDDRVKLHARKRLDELFGLAAPPRAPVDEAGNTVPGSVLNINLARQALQDEKARDLMAQLAEHAGGLPLPEELGLPCGLHELPPEVTARMQGDPPPSPPPTGS